MNARAAVAGPVFLARTGLRAGGRDAIVHGAIVAITAFLVTLAPLWFGWTADDVLQERLAAATEAQRGLEFELRGRLDPGGTDPLEEVDVQATALTAELPATIRAAVLPPDTLVDSQEFLAVGAPRPILRVGLRIQDVGDAIRWVEGRPPAGRTTLLELPDRPSREGGSSWANLYEAAFSTGTAAETDLRVGDRILLVPGTNTAGFVALDVVGLFDVLDPTAGRWFADPTLASSIEERVSQEVTIYHATALVNPGVYPVLYGAAETPGSLSLPFRYRWRYRLDATHLDTAGADALASDLARLRAAHPFAGAPGTAGLSTGLADLVERYEVDRAASATAVALAMIGPLAAMLATLALVAAAFATRRRPAVQVVRARAAASPRSSREGPSRRSSWPCPPGFSAGRWPRSPSRGNGSPGRWRRPSPCGLLGGTLAAGPAIIAARRPPAAREAGPGGRAARRRLVFDLLVVAIALGGAASLRGRDLAGAGELNLFLACVPVLLALAGGVVVLRLYPAAVRLPPGQPRPSGLVVVHGLRGVERGAAGQQVALLAVMLAVAIGVLSPRWSSGRWRTPRSGPPPQTVGRGLPRPGPGGRTPPATLDVGGAPGVEATATAARSEGTSSAPAASRRASTWSPSTSRPGSASWPAGRWTRGCPRELTAVPSGGRRRPTEARARPPRRRDDGAPRPRPGAGRPADRARRTISVRAVEARTTFPGLGCRGRARARRPRGRRDRAPRGRPGPRARLRPGPGDGRASPQDETDRYAPSVVMTSGEEILGRDPRRALLARSASASARPSSSPSSTPWRSSR